MRPSPSILETCELFRSRYNRREAVWPDPVHVLYRYDDVRDREIAGLVAASLAYGNVKQIVASVGRALEPMRPLPAAWLRTQTCHCGLEQALAGFRHRWTTGRNLAALLWGARDLCLRHGSLDAAMAAARQACGGDVPGAVSRWVRALRDAGGLDAECGLLPSPADGSACKRVWLYLRWMVRRDEVDPGGWTSLSPADLRVPLDVHLFRIARRWRFTRRRQPDARAAEEVTRAFARLAPDDPVRYDFALAKSGMNAPAPGNRRRPHRGRLQTG